MITLTADDDVLLKVLRLFVEPVEVWDAKGKFLGLFVPANLERGKQLYARVPTESERAEIERRKATPGRCYTTREVFEYLLTLTDDPQERADLEKHIAVLAKREKERSERPTGASAG